MTELIENKKINDWLSEPDNLELIKKIAVKVLFEIKTRYLEQYLLLDISTGDRNDRIVDVMGYLVVFISEKKTMQNILLSGEESMINQVKRSFINSIIDESRKTDLFKKLNRNCQAAVRASHCFTSLSDRQAGFRFFRTNSGEPEKILICDDDLKEIPFPFDICPETDYKFVNRQKVLIELVDWFHDQIKKKTGRKTPLIEMNIFVKWISFATVLTWQVESLDGASPEGREGDMDFKQKRFSEFKKAADQQTYAEAARCADAFANRLPETEMQVFFLFYCEELQHREVKEKMDRASSLSYYKKKVGHPS